MDTTDVAEKRREDEEDFINSLRDQFCGTCGDSINLPELISKGQKCENVIVINYHNEESNNLNVIFCGKGCLETFDNFGEIHCVICNDIRETPKWDMKIKFEALGGWISVRAVCSEKCQLVLKQEKFNDPTMELKQSCWYCKKLYDKQLPRCGRCKVAIYCDKVCQQRHWGDHRRNSCDIPTPQPAAVGDKPTTQSTTPPE
jgi:hypothetical protein